MNFSSKEDIDAPLEHVFEMMSDFEGFERAALRRGIEVQRADDLTAPGEGMAWDLSFMLRGKQREMRLTLVDYDAPQRMCFSGTSQGLDGTVDVDLVAMSRTRTRISIDIEMEANTLPARLLLQSLKLARNKMNKQFHVRMANYAAELEERYKRIG